MKIIDSGYRIDLHIHSHYSCGKDNAKVAFNSLDHVNVLAEKLNDNGVQICAITDHYAFGYDVYKELKKYEYIESSSIVKVFPAIEFSVEFCGDEKNAVVHVIAIFNDEDDEKIKDIPSHLLGNNGHAAYDRDHAFSEEKFLSILRDIDIDTILIAHQKSTLSCKNTYKNDARIVGEERFQEFIYMDYFEAYEFKNRKNEVFNKNFMVANSLTENIRFITGSDCHDWRYYPKENEADSSDFIYSYVKCLPSFRGLVMAITDHRRIKTVNSFFNPTETYTKEIQLKINGVDFTIPLSRGINVIIGDNSIGKSLLLHKLTGYSKKQEGLLKATVVSGYDKYLKQNNIEVKTMIPTAEVFAFDMQGEVREKFEQEKLKSDEFFRNFYPAVIHPDSYKEKIQREFKKIYAYLEERYAIELQEAQLGRFSVIDSDLVQAESITFVSSVVRNNKRVEGYNTVTGEIDSIVERLDTIRQNQWIESQDKEQIEYIIEQLDGLSMKYSKKKSASEFENTKIGLYQAALSNFKQNYQASISDSQKRLSTYNESIATAVDAISNLIIRKKANVVPQLNLKKEEIGINTNRVYDYEFNSRLGVIEIDTAYITNVLIDIFKKDTKKNMFEMSQADLAEALPHFQGTPSEALSELKTRVQSKLDEDFANKFTITQAGTDRTKELSAGFNAKIYFDILSHETNHRGVYIIDQPEDNISQKFIREYLLDRFKVMGENRQIIIVTHNPQFIVNLDVDNVIFIGKQEENIFVQSGALEYKDSDYDILNIISTHIEGGLDTLKRRWKRYEKNNSV